MYRYLFGPVPSRRLGMSLGVDLVPKKVCTLDCVYCEVGKTTKLSLERKEYIPSYKIREELEDYFSHNPDPDYITFSGSGEPMLNSGIADVLDFIKSLRPAIPVALLTNGTLLTDRSVREAVSSVDVVLPSLDAATRDVFEKINRPAEGINIEEYIGGIAEFRKSYKGKMWLEVMILPGYNDSVEELMELKKAILKINPDSVQINTLDRPGTIDNLRGATQKELEDIKKLWELDNVEIISSAPDRKHITAFRKDIESAILETIIRRPCTVDDLSHILGLHLNEVNKYLDVLDAEGRIESVKGTRGYFYQVKNK